MIKRLAIIPARKGSKRLKNKNIKLFCKKPLISYSIDALKKSKLFSKIHISTNSLKITKIAEKKGIKPDFLRPKSISNDSANIDKVIKYVLKTYKKQNFYFDEVWLIFATNPFISVKFIRDAYKLYKLNNKKFSIMPVVKFNKPIEWSMKIDKKKKLKPIFKKKNFQEFRFF